jgi:hypothetical protein
MLDKYKVLECLENKKAEFQNYTNTQSDTLEQLLNYLEELLQQTSYEITDLLKQIDNPGALPTEEWDSHHIIVKFNQKWHNHEQARQWAHDILLDKTTFSVDGSQILPTKDFSPPVAAIQVALFENLHCKDGQYKKDIIFDIVTSQELSKAEKIYPAIEDYIHFKRFSLEIDTLITYIENSTNADKTVIFFDGSLILSFLPFKLEKTPNKDIWNNYLNKMNQLLIHSEAKRIPLIGFVDTSMAYDLVEMIRNLKDTDKKHRLTDTLLLNSLMEWGDRSIVFQCKRAGIENSYGQENEQIYFSYMKTNKNLPARIEFPKWVFEDKGLFEDILNIIRGEIIAGSGYIYSIESADAVAALTSVDKRNFYRIFSDFAFKYNLGVNVAQKSVSKMKRR